MGWRDMVVRCVGCASLVLLSGGVRAHAQIGLGYSGTAAGGIPPLMRDALVVLMGAREVETVAGVPLAPPVSDAAAPQRTIIVRQGSRWEQYTRYTRLLPVPRLPDALVETATQTCVERSSVWRCSRYLNSDPASAEALGLPETGWSATGRRVILGQLCQGYRYTTRADPYRSQRFVYWVNPSTRRFVLVEFYLRAVSSSPSTALNVHVRAPFLRWNDPSLRALIPRVPGLTDGVVS